MLASLRRNYGDKLCTIDGVSGIIAYFSTFPPGEDFHTFPTLDQLSKAKESELRNLGFGYRAKYVVSFLHF